MKITAETQRAKIGIRRRGDSRRRKEMQNPKSSHRKTQNLTERKLSAVSY